MNCSQDQTPYLRVYVGGKGGIWIQQTHIYKAHFQCGLPRLACAGTAKNLSLTDFKKQKQDNDLDLDVCEYFKRNRQSCYSIATFKTYNIFLGGLFGPT